MNNNTFKVRKTYLNTSLLQEDTCVYDYDGKYMSQNVSKIVKIILILELGIKTENWILYNMEYLIFSCINL